jgi:DNA-binding NtrC family response regulator
MAAQARLSADDRAFFGGVGRAIFMNPFSDEREQLLGRVSPGHGGEATRLDPKFYAFVAEVDQRIAKLDRGGATTIDDFDASDRPFMEPVFLYQVYHDFVGDLDRLVRRQLEMGDVAAPVAFANDLLAQVAARGFSDEQSRHYLAMFYRLRRAFFFTMTSLVGDSRSMRALRCSLWNAMFTHDMHTYDMCLWNRMEDFSTLLLGETGTGKGSAAAVIGRSGLIPFDARTGRFAWSFSKAFVAINLSQFPEGLIESELFGHRKGAFTGAIGDHAGVLELCAEHGALFLDEIGEVSAPTQIKLLQVLQERTFTPLGSHEHKRFAGRVIGATNRTLAELRRGGSFRDDFFYRLCSDVIVVPPLRQRIEESPGELEQLVASLVERTTGQQSGALTARILDALARDLPKGYRWPGNVRELEQAVRRVLLTGAYRGDIVEEGDDASLDADQRFAREVSAGSLDANALLTRYCAMLYRRTGTYEEVARRTGLDRRTVRKYVIESDGA